MKELIKAKKDINSKVDYLVLDLEDFATKHNLNAIWVLETFANKLSYRVQKLEVKQRMKITQENF